ncbi:MAG TPA: NAD(P)/FAD-dependent oxidoreductase, partial [Anaerolineales bacterium]
GLVAATYLAKAGKKILVLERRGIVGGSVVTESFGDGFQADSVWAGGSLRPDIVKGLKLAQHGWTPSAEKPVFASLLSDSEALILDPDPAKAVESIKRVSEKDAARWPEFVAFMDRSASFLDTAYATLMPRLPKGFSAREGYGLLEMGLELRLMGRKDMLNLIRLLPMTAAEFLEEWFESEQFKAALASVAIHGVTLGPMSAGTGFTLLHNWLNRGGLAHRNVGRAGEITRALASALAEFGGAIRTEAEVKQVLVRDLRATGVVLAGGEEISAPTVLSGLDPKRTFLTLVGPMELPPEFVWHTQSIKMRGSVARVHLHVGADGRLPVQGTCVIAPSLKYLERAYDAAKYGEISEKPYLEVTTSGNVVSIHFQFAPYALKDGNWEQERKHLEDLAIDTLAEHFPNLKSSIINQKSLTPLDLEATYGLTEGDLNHGQLMLDQFLFMRPIPGWSDHRTPIDGLYLCGSGVHGGGGVSGASGRNAANVVLNRPKERN